MSKKYDTLVLIGRFQPVHSAHIQIIRRAIDLAKQLIIIVGSADQPRTYKNPFTAGERVCMLQSTIKWMNTKDTAIRIESNVDSIYNDQAWAARVQAIVAKHTIAGEKIGIIGHKKDESSFYLGMFPQWASEDVELIEPLNASNVRDLFFRTNMNINFLKNVVPDETLIFLENFAGTKAFEQIVREREFVETYRKQYAGLAYPPIFVTADAVVICAGHVLMIKRRSEPGKGLWALPGGYVNANTDKTIEDAMLRELREETGIKIPAPVLRGNIVRSRVFDAVDRSPRGRIVTHAFHIAISLIDTLPKVKGSDDAEKARWVPIAEVKREECFEDHYEIISHFVGA